MNLIKIIVSVILILISLWALFLPPLFPSSTRALVNASIYQINSPADGLVSELFAFENDLLAEGQPVVVIRRDQAKMLEEMDAYRFDVVQVQAELAAVKSSVLEQRNIGALETSNKLSRTLFELKIARQNEADAKESLIIAQRAESEITALFSQKIVTVVNLQKAQNDKIAARKIFNDSTKEVNQLKQTLESLKSEQKAVSDTQSTGLSNDRYFGSEVRSLGLREVTLEAELDALNQKILLLQKSLAEGEFYTVENPGAGLVWQQGLVENQILSRGDLMFKVANNEDVFIEAYLARHFLDSITIGDKAMIYLNDEGKFYSGVVANVQSQEQEDSRNFAIPSISPDSTTLKVKIDVDDKLGADRIGNLAKVIVTSPEPSLAEKLMIWMSVTLRTTK